MSVPAYSRYKASNCDWLGDVPDHWNLRRLGYFFEERRQKVSDKDFPALSVTKNGVMPQLETAAKTDDGDNRKRVALGDFVINSRSDRKGSSGVSPLDGSVSLINTVLKPLDGVEARFAHHLLRSTAFQEEYYRYGKGIVADLWSTNYSEMRAITLALPSFSEQTAIAAFLDRETGKLDALVEEQKRLIELLKEKRQAIISHAVTKGLDPDAPMKDSGVKWLGEVPKHWEVAPLKRFLGVVSGFAFPSSDFSHNSSDTPLLRGVNVAIGELRWNEVVYWSRREGDGLDAFELIEGDVVIGMDRPWIGEGLRIAHLTEPDLPCLLLQRVAALRPQRQLLAQYLVQLLCGDAFYHHCVPEMTGVSVPHISPSQIGDFVVALPPVHEQDVLVESLSKLKVGTDELIGTTEAAIALLQERRSVLISAAVTGKIDVRSMDKVNDPATPITKVREMVSE
ncbi:restriction endonuclease subunit S [Mesorhizobium sp.]|uniref:restriction endonuclease subunit S n=1 Tax=Mesorhizobium sp. TaxID=1871066 RepID=UPI0025E72F01|nr:restriction endonuclease subunit S [Mesorhizobium sp.]